MPQPPKAPQPPVTPPESASSATASAASVVSAATAAPAGPDPSLFRSLPSVDALLAAVTGDGGPGAAVPRPLLRNLANEFLDLRREEIRTGAVRAAGELALDALAPRLAAHVRVRARLPLRRVLNATGVVVHTNLGRSLLAREAVDAVVEAALHYSNLEFDVARGARGSRHDHPGELLRALTGAEAAMVVNNNAAAVLLVLDTFAKGREVIVSRGQLVEIGGSFRIPEVMAKSGATLREVGATNRTHLRDYENAIGPETAALMKVHTSNYAIRGFTREVALPELVALGRRHGLPVFEDLGSGSFVDFTGRGPGPEPTAQQAVAQGADLVTFSGDKVLGGPQAGIVLGRKDLVDRLKSNPLARAVRVDKMTLAGLCATLRLYHDPERAARDIPTLRMILASYDELRSRARRLAARIRKAVGPRAVVSVRRGESRVGGGAFPGAGLPTALVCVAPTPVPMTHAPMTHVPMTPDGLRRALLDGDPPLVGRIEGDAFCLDPRTLDNAEFALAAQALAGALGAEDALGAEGAGE
ncbi:MAG: L-seryl-tRNA(Sec) selenium transferase [Desulfovibrionaceae bacterium]|jgi:L-seryl-tRNA(Ser) seleniumtransferase|nr:L-seryl-tRNA(Sec) selenium transferase [Desulfovibrionaceae bacterium]